MQHSPTIESIHAREILDSRGNPTVSVQVFLSDNSSGGASVPSGASTGSHEAHELRDGDEKRYGGKGVLRAVKYVNTSIAQKLKGKKVFDIREIDEAMIELDGTVNKQRIGANAILGVSLACAHAGAVSAGVPLYRYLRMLFGITSKEFRLPIPTMNVMNGGAHAGWLVDLQECMIVPHQKRFAERVRAGSEIFHTLGRLLKKRGFSTLVGDEGGYAVPLKKNEQVLQWLMLAIEGAGYTPGEDVFMAMDAAASEFYKASTRQYVLQCEGKKYRTGQMIALYERWLKKYPLLSLEDGLAEDDWAGWELMTKKLGKQLTLVGDDLFVTNKQRVQQGIDHHVANAVLIKPNQIGSLSETIDTIQLAQKAGYQISLSHRSGETPDTTIADMSVAFGADFIKTGSLSRGERLAKYNRLMEIEDELAS